MQLRFTGHPVVKFLGLLFLFNILSGQAADTPSSLPFVNSAPAVLPAMDEPRADVEPLQTTATPTACWVNTGLPDVLERTYFCVHYDSATNTITQATTVADIVEDYWDRYTTDFGFQPPLSSYGKLKVKLLPEDYCNGGATQNTITVFDECFKEPELMQQVVGHQLFHHVQLQYDPYMLIPWHGTRRIAEGSARAMQDQSFDNIDCWPKALSTYHSFNRAVNDYLVSTKQNMMQSGEHASALWWKYFMERYGSVTGEPQLGVGAMVHVMQAMSPTVGSATYGVKAVNEAMRLMGVPCVSTTGETRPTPILV